MDRLAIAGYNKYNNGHLGRRLDLVSSEDIMRRARKKYIDEKTDEIKFRVPKGNKERIQEHAKAQGESTNAFIYRAVNEAIERDRQK